MIWPVKFEVNDKKAVKIEYRYRTFLDGLGDLLVTPMLTFQALLWYSQYMKFLGNKASGKLTKIFSAKKVAWILNIFTILLYILNSYWYSPFTDNNYWFTFCLVTVLLPNPIILLYYSQKLIMAIELFQSNTETEVVGFQT